ncbi:MAG: type II toxin-antitoxin system RelE/ParE family toxin [Candidatus Doudnabacteria bacterium]|nr:type II toxin-antitoxin system RelE/ParE family toxin [Candidatus Doudnabacteria bacterium]
MPYRVVVPRRVQKELDRIDKRFKPRILAALTSLALNPFLGKKLEGEFQGDRSYEVWPYRIIYRVKQSRLTLLVLKIGHRQGVYK